MSLYRPRETLRLLNRRDERILQRRLPRDWAERAQLHHQLGEYRKEAALAARARKQYPERPGTLYWYVHAIAALGRVAEVNALIDSALSAPRDPYYTPGTVMHVAAEELRAHGHPAEAMKLLFREIDWYRSTPVVEADSLMHSSNLAYALYLAGRLSEAQPIFLQLAEQPTTQRVFLYGSLGSIAARTGDRVTAQRYLDVLSHLPVADGAGYEAVLARARISALLGDADSALHLLREAVGGQGMDLHTEFDFEQMLNQPAFREFTRPKG
jgi:tetratricopeptide (TPR) repeat protein